MYLDFTEKADFVTLPVGTHHHSTLGEQYYVGVMQLFVGETAWTVYGQPADPSDPAASKALLLGSHPLPWRSLKYNNQAEKFPFLSLLLYCAHEACLSFLCRIIWSQYFLMKEAIALTYFYMGAVWKCKHVTFIFSNSIQGNGRGACVSVCIYL